MASRLVSFLSNGVAVSGILHLPTGRVPYPMLVICHGFRSNKENQAFLAERFCRQGFAVLRFDFFGSGESGGRFEDFTVAKGIEDIRNAIDFVSRLPEIDKQRIFVYGASLGGLIAGMQASRDRRIKGLVLLSAVSEFQPEKYRVKIDITSTASLAEWKRAGIIETVSLASGKVFRIKYAFFQDAVRHSLWKAAAKIACPVLVVHGAADTVVPPAQSQKLAALLASRRLVLLPGVGHKFTDEDKEKLVSLAVPFLRAVKA